MKIFSLLVFAVLLAGCSTGVPPEIRTLMVGTEDIPQEWIIFKESAGKDWGGELYNLAFAYGNDSTSPAVEQQLIVYGDEAAALKGFGEYSTYMFVDGWSHPAEATFAPSSPDDRFEYMCTDRELDHVMLKSCFILQQHGIYVSAVGVQMGDPLTFAVLDKILQAIDGKLVRGR